MDGLDFAHYAWFSVFIVGLLALDLGVFNRKNHEIGLKEASLMSLVWISIGLAFGGFVYYNLGSKHALDYLVCYGLEKALSVDNLFVFLAIFSFFDIKGQFQHRLLYWGILGAIVTRCIFIFCGVALLNQLAAMMYVFGAFLIYKGFKMWVSEDEKPDFENIWVIRFLKRMMPNRFSTKPHNGKFVTTETDGRRTWWAFTPLVVVLIVVEFTDVAFAVDSIPAIIGITKNQFVLITSNIMAILGLRSLYFVLAAVQKMFCYLQKGMCLVLIYIGAKMIGHHYIEHWFGDNATWYSLIIIGTFIFGSIILSVIWPAKEEDEPKNGDTHK